VLRPEVGELFVGTAAQQHAVRGARETAEDPAHRVLAVRRGPAAVREITPQILVRQPRRLHDTVQRQVAHHSDLAHACLLA
jgi:hypothetical protein